MAAAAAAAGNATLSPQQQQKCEAESDTEESDDSDGQPSTPSEGGDREEFFEALEVLNQHDYFVATSIKHSDGVDLHDSPEQVAYPNANPAASKGRPRCVRRGSEYGCSPSRSSPHRKQPKRRYPLHRSTETLGHGMTLDGAWLDAYGSLTPRHTQR
jgi:hypothetical protein